jgi:sialic acid synthase SpsE
VDAVSVLVIAEPGATAEGDYATMVKQIHVAADCGANVWKPQWTSDPDAMVARRKVPEKYRKFYGWLKWPIEWHGEFKRICAERGMEYAVSVYLPRDVAVMVPFVDYLKISSFEATDGALLDAARRELRRSEVIVSLGMGAQWDYQEWVPRLLHCVSSYPAQLGAMNLSILPAHDEWAGLADPSVRWEYAGLSDHSRHVLTGAIAVACGARVIETHYRLEDCDPENPDYAVAFMPAEFAQYVQNIRDAELMLGDGIKRLQPCEAEMAQYRVT